MKEQVLLPDETISDYVNDILLLENNCAESETTALPFYADGYPGIMFSDNRHGVYHKSQNRKLSDFILYGQTLLPIELSINGSYSLIVFRLYPFASKLLLGVDPKILNDDCFDLAQLPGAPLLLEQLAHTENLTERITLISTFLKVLIDASTERIDPVIRKAVALILDEKGAVTIKSLREQLHVGERTFERMFISQIGIPPKKFAKIIQFDQSRHQLTQADYRLLTDVVFDNGFADQSHFIRTFKKFTGKTPTGYQKVG